MGLVWPCAAWPPKSRCPCLNSSGGIGAPEGGAGDSDDAVTSGADGTDGAAATCLTVAFLVILREVRVCFVGDALRRAAAFETFFTGRAFAAIFRAGLRFFAVIILFFVFAMGSS